MRDSNAAPLLLLQWQLEDLPEVAAVVLDARAPKVDRLVGHGEPLVAGGRVHVHVGHDEARADLAARVAGVAAAVRVGVAAHDLGEGGGHPPEDGVHPDLPLAVRAHRRARHGAELVCRAEGGGERVDQAGGLGGLGLHELLLDAVVLGAGEGQGGDDEVEDGGEAKDHVDVVLVVVAVEI